MKRLLLPLLAALALPNYVNADSLPNQKNLRIKPLEEGFSLVELVVVVAVLAILSVVAIPAFVKVAANAQASAVKNALINGIKECVNREADNKSTNFSDAQSFANPNAYDGYIVDSWAAPRGFGDSCYSAYATAISPILGDFMISLDPSTGLLQKPCEAFNSAVANTPGCNRSTASW